MKHRQDQESETSDSQMDQIGIRDRAKEFIGTVPVGTNCSIGLVPPSQVPNVWEKILPHIERMAPHSEGELEPDDFFEALTEGEMQLWVAIKDHDIIASMISLTKSLQSFFVSPNSLFINSAISSLVTLFIDKVNQF